jgi:hypothetical protein
MYRYHCEDENIDAYESTSAYAEESEIELKLNKRPHTISKKASVATDLRNSYAVITFFISN